MRISRNDNRPNKVRTAYFSMEIAVSAEFPSTTIEVTVLTFGSERAHCDVSHHGRVHTFRATVQEEPQGIIMKLEGRMVGPWVTECRRAWLALASSLSPKKLAVDLCGVTFMDEAGLELLREIYSATRAEMVTNSPLTKHFAEQAMRSTTNRKKEV